MESFDKKMVDEEFIVDKYVFAKIAEKKLVKHFVVEIVIIGEDNFEAKHHKRIINTSEFLIY